MQWLRKLLDAKGFPVTDGLLADVQKELPKHWIPKEAYNSKLKEMKFLKQQLEAQKIELSDLKEQSAMNMNLQEQNKIMQEKYHNDMEALKADLYHVKFQSTLELALVKSGARSHKALIGLLDMEKISFDNGALMGLDDQLSLIRTQHDYLFTSELTSTAMRHGSTPVSSDAYFTSIRTRRD